MRKRSEMSVKMKNAEMRILIASIQWEAEEEEEEEVEIWVTGGMEKRRRYPL